LMEREGLDAATAYERLRAAARPSSRKVVDVARQLLAGVPLPPNEPMGRQQPNTRTRR
jgi:AmiR/NasT family two-component response regulator